MKKIILALILALFTSLLITPTTYAETAEEYFNQGNKMYKEKNFEEAITNYTKSIELAPSNSRCFYNRGISYHNLNHYDKAIGDKVL